MRNCGVTKGVVCRCSCKDMAYHTEISNHLDQNIGIIWHKRSIRPVTSLGHNEGRKVY